MGLAYIASVLRHAGHEVQILDINGYRYSHERVRQEIKRRAYDVVGIGGLITAYNYVKWLAGAIREERPKVTIIQGDGLATEVPELLLERTEVDIAVIGEGEETAVELVDVLERSGDLGQVNGIYYKKDGEIHRTSPRALIDDLDTIPFPAYDLLAVEEIYLQNTTSPKLGTAEEWPARQFSSIVATRGCPYNCNFCHQLFTRRHRRRSADNVIREMKFLVDKYEIEWFHIGLDLFIANKKRTAEFCDNLIEANLNVKWSTPGRVNLIADDEAFAERLKAAGCEALSFGFESGSQKILDKIGKGVTVEQARRAVETCRRMDGKRHSARYGANWLKAGWIGGLSGAIEATGRVFRCLVPRERSSQ